MIVIYACHFQQFSGQAMKKRKNWFVVHCCNRRNKNAENNKKKCP